MPCGSHFATLEAPELFVEDVRAFAQKLRGSPQARPMPLAPPVIRATEPSNRNLLRAPPWVMGISGRLFGAGSLRLVRERQWRGSPSHAERLRGGLSLQARGRLL